MISISYANPIIQKLIVCSIAGWIYSPKFPKEVYFHVSYDEN